MTSDTASQDGRPGGELVPFPGAPERDTGYEIEPDVLEGEIVDDELPPSGPARAVHVVRVVVQHEHDDAGRAAPGIHPARRRRRRQAPVGLAHHGAV
jgi:hypothetical protein